MVDEEEQKFLLIGITMSSPVEEEARLITKFLREGVVDLFHIRHPELTLRETEALIASIPENLRHRLTLHDHFQLVRTLGVGGIHLNRRNSVIPEELSEAVPNLRISRSCHNPEELMQAEGLAYVTLSPIFDSISKEGYHALIPLERLHELKPMISRATAPVIALGGVTPDKKSMLRNLGFSGMAMLGSIWSR